MMKKSNQEVKEIYQKYHDMVWRICLMQMGNSHDAYDCTQETFIRFINSSPKFQSEEHQKAWLIRVAINYCTDVKKSSWRKKLISMTSEEMYEHMEVQPEHTEVYETMMELPDKYRAVLYLYFYEGYSLTEISEILKVNKSTLRSRFAKAKEIMKKYLEDEK